MKILFVFKFYEGNLQKYYNKLKILELLKAKSLLQKRIMPKDLDIAFYCLNKEENFIKKNNFDYIIKSLLNEYLYIERKEYRKLVQSVLSEIKISFEKLTKPHLPNFNIMLSILEAEIKHTLHDYIEQLIFLDSIFFRENFDFILISLKENHLIKSLEY